MDIFLGYPSEHRLEAREIYAFLKSLGHSVWMDSNELVGGIEWRRERESAQRKAKLIIHLCAEEMMFRSGDVNREIRLTLDLIEDQPLGSLFAIFIRLSDFRLPVELTRLQYIDKFREDWRDRLEAAVTRREQQLTRSASAPKLGEVLSEAPATHGEARTFDVIDNGPPDQASAQYLQYDRSGVYWQWVNSEIAAKALNGFFSAKQHFKEARTDADPDWVGDRSFSWEFTTEEFFLRDNIISVRLYTYTYLGGAHPNHYVETLNFIGPDHGQLRIQELLDNDFNNARRLIDYCERVVIASFEHMEHPAEFHLLDKNNELEVWQALAQFNIDDKGITFNFSPYVVMAYAFGTQTVIIPWQTMYSFFGNSGQMVAARIALGT